MTTSTKPSTDTRRFAARVVDRVLAHPHSMLTARKDVWSKAACQHVTGALEQAAQDGEGQFANRWTHVLARLTDNQRLLAGEALAIHLWFPDDVSPQTKLAALDLTAGCLDEPFTIEEDQVAAICEGVSGSGVAYGVRRLSQLAYLTRVAAALKELDARSRRDTLGDPWKWKSFLYSVSAEGGTAQREVLLHLVHPETFEPIVSVRVKQQIADAHAEHIPAELTDVDAQLAFLREWHGASTRDAHLRDFLLPQ